MNLASLIIGFVTSFLNKWLAAKRAEQAMRDLGAASQAAAARAEAERQEAIAKAVGEAAANEPDDPRDIRREP